MIFRGYIALVRAQLTAFRRSKAAASIEGRGEPHRGGPSRPAEGVAVAAHRAGVGVEVRDPPPCYPFREWFSLAP